MKAKPIALIKMPKNVTHEEINYARKALRDQLKDDYHVLVINDESSDIFDMQVFYEKDFTEVKYKELKAIIEKLV